MGYLESLNRSIYSKCRHSSFQWEVGWSETPNQEAPDSPWSCCIFESRRATSLIDVRTSSRTSFAVGSVSVATFLLHHTASFLRTENPSEQNMRAVFLVLFGVVSNNALTALTTPGHRRHPPLQSTVSPEQQDLNNAARVELESFASECNPSISYFDPLQLADKEFWGLSNAATIAFLRHAEMKHGRIAMLGFLGYVAQANHLVFPWATEVCLLKQPPSPF